MVLAVGSFVFFLTITTPFNIFLPSFFVGGLGFGGAKEEVTTGGGLLTALVRAATALVGVRKRKKNDAGSALFETTNFFAVLLFALPFFRFLSLAY